MYPRRVLLMLIREQNTDLGINILYLSVRLLFVRSVFASLSIRCIRLSEKAPVLADTWR